VDLVTTRARIEADWHRGGIRAVIVGPGYVRTWEDLGGVNVSYDRNSGATPEIPEGRTEWLRFQEDEARALYEELASYFGGTGHDTRALRKDYDDERRRVDRLTEGILAIAVGAPLPGPVVTRRTQ
jgi:hypothetical protein